MEIREWKMGKILKILSLVLVSLALVFGTGIDADAKKKKKKIELTEAEKAMFDKWEVKPKKRAKAVKIMRKKPQFVGAVKCNGSCRCLLPGLDKIAPWQHF